MDERTERAKLALEQKQRRLGPMAWEIEEMKLCTCGAAGTLEGHAEECPAAAKFNPPGKKHRTVSKGRGP